MLLLFRFILIMTISLCSTRKAWARWNHQDADALDRVTQRGTEFYNDILSYRDPWHWNEIWAGTSLGLRTSAASMNKKSFLHVRDIKLRSSTTDSWQVAYFSELLEDSVHRTENSSLELSYGPEGQSWRLGFLGDAMTEKSFMDLGMNVSWAPSGDSWYRLIYWSVDPFYTEKKLESQDFRTQNPSNLEVETRHERGALSFSARHSQDQPVEWQRPLRDEYYTSRQQRTDIHMEYSSLENQKFHATLQQEQRRESLYNFNRDSGQGFTHKEHVVELGLRHGHGRDAMLWAIWGLTSQTRVLQARGMDEQTEYLNQGIHRQETAFLWNSSSPLGDSEHQQDWGLTVNHVNIHGLGSARRTEVKLNWGPDFQISKQGRIKLNSTWDIDQLASDFPFIKKPFHPWGGGQAGFLLYF